MNAKLTQFIKRNRRRNEHLYQPGLVQGQDYVVCPVSNQRLSMIKSSYIEKILGMTVSDYETLYPNIERICSARKENIKNGLKEIDNTTGLTKYKIGQLKAKQTLSSIDETGVSGYKKKGQKTRATHMSKIDELGRNGYRRQADARLTTILSNGLTVEQNAHKKQKETLIKNNKTGNGGASKLSKKAFEPVLEFLKEKNIRYYFDKTEYGIKDSVTGKYYFWDLTIPELKMVIEYQSNAWHANPLLSEQEWKNWRPSRGKKKTADEILKYDYDKAKSLYRNRGYLTYYIWQKSEKENIKEIMCLLKTMIMKS